MQEELQKERELEKEIRSFWKTNIEQVTKEIPSTFRKSLDFSQKHRLLEDVKCEAKNSPLEYVLVLDSSPSRVVSNMNRKL